MSCLFNSLSYFITDNNSYEIRQKICDYLQENKPIMDGLDTNFILELENNTDNASKYIQNMRNTWCWGGAIEIQCACNIWNLRIIVRNYRDRKGEQIEFIPVSSSLIEIVKTIELEWTGGHYEPVRNK
jgi:hypothetical protein